MTLEQLKKCRFYEEGRASLVSSIGKPRVVCSVQDCPYGKQGTKIIHHEEESYICNSNGFLKPEEAKVIYVEFGK